MLGWIVGLLILAAQVAWIGSWCLKRCREQAALTEEDKARMLAHQEEQDRIWRARPHQTFGEAFQEGASHPAAPLAGLWGFFRWGG